MKVKKALLAVISVIILVLIPIALMNAAQPTASAEPVISCVESQHGNTLSITCSAAGVQIFHTSVQIPIDVKTVTVKIPVPGPIKTITVPGPVKTILEPGSTHTVTLPGHTVTSTVTNYSTANATVTIGAQAGNVTRTVNVAPSAVSTITVINQVTRQPPVATATIVPPAKSGPAIHLPSVTLSAPAAVGIGFLTLLILAALIVLGLWMGYYLGYKDSDRDERKFLKALLRK